jgi:hypothetical protein
MMFLILFHRELSFIGPAASGHAGIRRIVLREYRLNEKW